MTAPPLRLWSGQTLHKRFFPFERAFRYQLVLIDIDIDRLDEASEAFAVERNTLLSYPGKAIVAAKQGNVTAASEMLRMLATEHGDNGLYQQAQILAQIGEPENALATLEKAYAANDSGLVYLLNDPFLRPIHGQARYKALLKRMRFV